MAKRKASVALDTSNESNQSSSTLDNSSNSTSATNTASNTNSGVLNGTSTTTGRGTGPINDNGSNNQNKNKKERADNWSNTEIQVLHRGIESRRDIFYGPPNQATKKNRELAWESITKEVNSVSTTPRSLNQVMKKFKNEKCRAKRKFIGTDKEGHNSLGNSNNSNNTTNNTNLGAQGHTTNNQQQIQSHHLTAPEPMPPQNSSINVVKLAPQNVAKTMIDLPGHVQQIQMPNDDMVLIVPPEMDGLLNGMNIVSDALNNQQHNHHNQHTIQAINTGPGMVNGTMTNGMMARTIPAGSMCSLVYSTGSEVCGSDQQITSNNVGPNQLPSNHLSVNGQGLMQHRNQVEQNPQQHQQQHQQQQHHHHQHLNQPPTQHQHQHPQAQHPHQPHLPAQHPLHHLQHNQLGANATSTCMPNTSAVGASSSPAVAANNPALESQLKNLLFNMLLKDNQHSGQVLNSSQDHTKQRDDMLAVIASSLNKIEHHLGKIAKVAGSLLVNQNSKNNSIDDETDGASSSLTATINLDNRGGTTEGVIVNACANNLSSQENNES